MTSNQRQAASYPANGSALAVLTLPYVFTQDRLLSADEFIKAAEERGYKITLSDLQVLHSNRLHRRPPDSHLTHGCHEYECARVDI